MPFTYRESRHAVFIQGTYDFPDPDDLENGGKIEKRYWAAHHPSVNGTIPEINYGPDGPEFPEETEENLKSDSCIHVDINPSAMAMCREVLVWAFKALNAIQDDGTFKEVTKDYMRRATQNGKQVKDVMGEVSAKQLAADRARESAAEVGPPTPPS